MGRRKAVRTVEEEEEFQRLKRERKAINQQKYREKNKENAANNVAGPSKICKSQSNSTLTTPNSKLDNNNVNIIKRLLTTNEVFASVVENTTKTRKMDEECQHCRAKHFHAEKVHNKELLHTLDNIIRSNNIFAQSYQMMHEEIRDLENLGLNVPDLKMGFLNKKTGIDRGRYNVQRTNEVAAIFSTTADGDIPDCYVTIRNKRNKTLKYVSTMDPNVEPWIYPMYYPHGTQGWCDDIKQINGKRVTRSMYVQYRIAVRDNFNVYLMGKRLFQQWLVDSYVKIEKDRINWCKENQKQLRVEKHQGLIDYLEKVATNANARIGRVMILPSTFIGSPRNMMQNYQDAMAIVRKYGKPDVFITMTCNPNWLEIKENLLSNQQPADRPDICARKFFGEVKAFVYVIEFQKRGLPHVHMLVTLKQNCKISNSETVDKPISAEIPDPAIDKNLYEIVMKNMIHGPCGDWCMVNRKCSKHFPKPFHEETTMDENGYPQYRRRNTNISYEKLKGFVVDNRFVVPYCPILLMIFNCHINVEVVSSIKSVKYLYKYIYKGHDAASVVIGENLNNIEIVHDEIKDFIEARYVGPVEAYWRIAGKTLQEKSHAIIRLPVHLPNEQNVIISNNLNEENLRYALERITMLMDYFDLNKRDIDACQYVYTDIPSYYVFKKVTLDGKQVNRWEKRQCRFNCIGRMYSVSPTEIELFHLRILLLNVKGATSYNELKTVNGELHQTFTSACLALGLIEDDNEWKLAINEASVWMMPKHLRLLFVRILMHCQPVHPKELWEEFKVALSEDYIRRFGQVTGIRKAYVQIDQLLRKEGWELSQFPEMEQITAEYEKEDTEQLQREALLGQQQYSQLNCDQKSIVDYVSTLLEKNDSQQIKCLYIDGPGGSGKTFVYTTLYYLLKSQGKVVSSMAFTGIAATLLPNGRTVHKTLGLPVPLFADSTSNIKIQSKEADCLKKTDVFIWDEAPMAPRYALEIMNYLLQDIMQNNIPFGGKIVVLGGDFRQLLPVKQKATRSETVNLSIKFSSLWQHFKIFSLTENMRILPHEHEFAHFLLDLGNGTLNDQYNNVEVPLRCLADLNADIVKDTYEEIIKHNQYRLAAKRAILSARNVDVDAINKQVVNLLEESTERIYTSVDTAETTNDNHDINEAILTEYLNTLNPPNLPPHELRLRKYTVIMLIRNLNISE
ncbi:PREDICTED: uncharacterized protein LOC105556523, partial [Vollenhovia emeryi]|uniref:uncharacterized protein LOC105556523 n=1 Tax=Vollenhovia emeryi TaxID=411798 RepID=UPI0005F393A5